MIDECSEKRHVYDYMKHLVAFDNNDRDIIVIRLCAEIVSSYIPPKVIGFFVKP